MPDPKTAFVLGDAGVTILARAVGGNGTSITQSSLSTLKFQIWRCFPKNISFKGPEPNILQLRNGEQEKPPESSGPPQSFTISSVVFNTLQTGAVWKEDAVGFNFRADLPATSFPSPTVAEYPKKRFYEVMIQAAPTTGAVFGWNYYFAVEPNLWKP
ncbi:MAG: hypothetical protein ACRC1K_21620 [Planctomycetia bacterium]